MLGGVTRHSYLASSSNMENPTLTRSTHTFCLSLSLSLSLFSLSPHPHLFSLPLVSSLFPFPPLSLFLSGICYPVVTISFLLKHQLTYMICQRQQKIVTEKNAVCFEIIQKAFPLFPEPKVGENQQQLALEDLPTAVVARSKGGVSKGRASTIPDEL